VVTRVQEVVVDIRAIASEMSVVGGDDAARGHRALLMGGGAADGVMVSRLAVDATTVRLSKSVADGEPFVVPGSIGLIHSWGVDR
jgi:hypothetical protein